MPEMELRGTSVEVILAQIFAYMGWPDDAERRRTYVARRAVWNLGRLDEAISTLSQSQLTPTVLEFIDRDRAAWQKTFADFGGFASIYRHLWTSDEVVFPITEIHTTGDVLILIRSIKENYPDLIDHASLRGASFLIDRGKGWDGTLKSRRNIEDCFRIYRSVAHLCAAARLISNTRHLRSSGDILKDTRDSDGMNQEDLLLLITLSQKYWEFGTTFRPNRSPRPKGEFLLDSKSTWSFPKSIYECHPSLKYDQSVAPPLDDGDIKALRENYAVI
jgi:hypothetical protein